MRHIGLGLFILGIIFQGCNERKTEKVFSTTVDTGTDIVDTTLLQSDSTIQKDSIPTKLPESNSDTKTVAKPESEDRMPVARPDSIKGKELK
jgi:hypothetical protein